MTRFLLLMPGILLLGLSACGTVSEHSRVPVEERADSGRGRGDEAVMPESDGETPESTRTQSSPRTSSGSGPAVIAMLDEADKKRRAGNHAAAVSSLERALALEPKNAYLWYRLAVLKLEQRDWQQAYVMANKSNSLVRDNRGLRINNWQVIAAAKRQQGDTQAAQNAEREIRRLQSEE